MSHDACHLITKQHMNTELLSHFEMHIFEQKNIRDLFDSRTHPKTQNCVERFILFIIN